MSKFTLILAMLFMASCAKATDDNIRISKSTLTHKAYYWIGLDERDDRYVLKDILGVDPVRVEWCAAFVNMVLLENDLPTSASVSNHPLTARSFLRWGEKVTDPTQGDILIFKRGNSGWQGHVAFYVSSTTLDGKLYYYVLGGNQEDKVSVDMYPASKLLGIRRAPKV
jgi:uncharacterized protein (TIGR02594 family)